MPLNVGDILERRYKIEKKIGEGGFGAVYRAYDTRLDVFCAVKESFDSSEEAARQFKRGASMLAGLRHAHLPRVTDFFDIPNKGLYLVMDFVQGEDLISRIKRLRQALPEDQVVVWLQQICSALIYIHSQNPPIIHRDIKPQNIIIDQNDNAILVDFGLAKQYKSGQHTSTGARGLTPGFASLEQYGMGATDARSDIYSLGATAYAMLTAQVPLESIQRVVNASPLSPPRNINPRISETLSEVIMQAMEIDPRQRPQTAQDFLNKLNGESYSINKRALDNSTSHDAETTHLQLDAAESYVSQGLVRQAKDDLDGAIKDYSEAIRIQPNYADAYFNRGIARKAKYNLDGAIKDFTKAIRLNSNYVAEAYNNRGYTRLINENDGRDVDQAIQDYTEAIHLKPDYVEAYFNRGAARMEKGDLDGALKDYNKIIQLNPDYADVYMELGHYKHYKKGDLDGAIKDYTEAIRIHPDDSLAYSGRGDVYKAKGNLDGAIKDYTVAIHLRPNSINYYRLGYTCHEKGDLDGAIQAYTEAIRLDLETLTRLGIERDYEPQELMIVPYYALSYLNRGTALIGKDDLDGAINDLTEAIRLNNRYVDAYFNRGLAHDKKGDLDEAIKDYNATILIQPNHANAYYNRGNIWEEKNNINAAIADYQKYLGLEGGLHNGDQVEVEEWIKNLKKKTN